MRRIVAVYLRHGFFNPFSILVRLGKYSIIIISQKTFCLLYKQLASKKNNEKAVYWFTPQFYGVARPGHLCPTTVSEKKSVWGRKNVPGIQRAFPDGMPIRQPGQEPLDSDNR